MLYLSEISRTGAAEGYPFTVPAVLGLTKFVFTSPITVICGDNGCGKTTFIELIVRLTGCNRIKDTQQDKFRGEALEDALKCFKTVRQAIPRHKFFFSSEEFIKYIEWVEREKRYSKAMIAEIEKEYGRNTTAAGYAKMAHCGTLGALENMYSADLMKVSHGEGFMEFFDRRLAPEGFYVMDEPEGALTYRNQYNLAVKIREAAKNGCQFIVATHSPVIAAIPEADIYQCEDGVFEKRCYEQLDNIGFLEMFMRRRDMLFKD